MSVEYFINEHVTTDEFISLLHRSSLGKRRPVDDRVCMEGAIANSNLVITARQEGELIGISRCMTDFHYACYLSDLAVDQQHQHLGIGKKLLQITQDQLGPRCKLILLAAPAANTYYEHLGFTNNSRCWLLERDQTIS